MKRLFIFSLLLVSVVAGFGQGSKFKSVNRIPIDSTTGTSSFIKDAIHINGSLSPQLSPGAAGNSYGTLNPLQLPGQISTDSASVIPMQPVERKPAHIRRNRSQSYPVTVKNDREMLHDFFKEAPLLHIDTPEKQIRVETVHKDHLGISHLKGIQLFRDIPVYGMEFTFHISSQEETFMGYTLNPALIDTLPAQLTKDDAIRITKTDLGKTVKIQEPLTADAIYYPDRFHNYRISYKVIIRPNFRDEWIYYIDARTGEILHKFNNTPSAGPAKGTGLDLKNVQRTVDTYEENGIHYMLNTTKSMFNATNFSGLIQIYDAHNNPDIYTSNSTASLAASNSAQWNNPHAISAMQYVSQTYDYLKNTFNRTSYDDKGMNMICVINLPDENGQSYDNAFWNGSGIYFGNGSSSFLPLIRGLDCVAHEMGHGVVANTANLEYQNQSGAVNEGYADIFGSMVDRANWSIGEDIIKDRNNYPTGFLRDMSNPHNGGSRLGDGGWQPAHVSEMYLGDQDNGGVHINNTIPSHAFFSYATSSSKEKAEQVFYRALCNYLTSTSKFVDLRLAVIQSAKDLYGDAEAKLVAQAFDKVGVMEDAGSGTPGDLSTNPGQQSLLLTNLANNDPYGLYKTSDFSTFTPLTYSRMKSKPSVTDNGSHVFFVDANSNIGFVDLNTGQQGLIANDGAYANCAISRDGNRLAFVTTAQDAKIYVYDFVSQTIAACQLYNPTTGSGNTQSGGVMFAESIEFDHTGEYILYDAYNVIGSSLGGATIDYWDMGLVHVWNNNANTFGSGQISKLFAALEQGVSVGNPTFSKNSPYIVAFDYMDTNQNFATFGMNLSTNTMNMLFTNSTTSFPNYSINDNAIAFASFNNAPFTGYVALGADKISITGQGIPIATYATFPVFYGTGARPLGQKPATAFSVDVRAGGAPLIAQFVDLSENAPTSWSWTFAGGVPATSTAQHPKVTYNLPGTYPVKLTATNSYGSHEVVKQGYITIGTTGMDETAAMTVSVFPNPASTSVTVSGTWTKTPVFRLFDSIGRPVIETKETTFDISSLPAGIYLLSIQDGNTSSVKKIVKK